MIPHCSSHAVFVSFLIHFTLINLCKISQVLSQVQILLHKFIGFHPPKIHFLSLLKLFNMLSCNPRRVNLSPSGFPDSHAGLLSKRSTELKASGKETHKML